MDPINPAGTETFYEEVRSEVNSVPSISSIMQDHFNKKQLPGSYNSAPTEAAGLSEPPPISGEEAEAIRANSLSEYGEQQIQQERKRIGVMDIVGWVTSPLMALGDFTLAPIAEGAESIPEAFKIGAKAAWDRLHPTLGENAKDYAGEIVESNFSELPTEIKGLMSMGLSAATDPMSYIGFTGMKALQKGLEAKSYQKAGLAPVTNKGLLQEGVERLAGLADDYDPAQLTRVGKVAARADRGDKEAYKELSNILQDKKLMAAAESADLADVQRKLRDYRTAFGDANAPYVVYDKTVLQQVSRDMGLMSDEVGKNIDLNLARIDTTDDVNMFLDELTTHFEGMLKDAKGTTNNIKITEQAAKESLQDLIGRKPENFSSAQAVAIRQALVASSTTAQKLISKAAKSKDPIDHLAAMKAFKLNLAIMHKAIGVKSHAGRLLQSQRIVAQAGRQQYGEIMRAVNSMGDEVSRDFMRLLEHSGVEQLAPHEYQRLADRGLRGFMMKGYDGFYEAYVNAILSGPLTHAVNITSNGVFMMARPTEKYLKGISAAARMDFMESASQFRQANASVAGMMGGISDVFRIVVRGQKASVDYPEALEKMHELARQKVRPALTAENFHATGWLGKGVDFMGSIIRLPGDALLKEDKAFKLINYRMGVNEEAAKLASAAGKSGADIKAIFRAVRANPDEHIRNQAVDLAGLYTFTNKLGEMGQRLEKAARVPGINLLVPFFRTPTNILKYGARNSVITNLAYDLPKLFSAKGGARDAAFAKLAMGTLAPLSVAVLLGDKITGAVDTSTEIGRVKAKYEGPAYSIKIGDKWVSYEKIEPLRSILGLIANYKDFIEGLDDRESDYEQMSFQGAIALAQPFVQTIADNAMLDMFGHAHYMIDGIMSDNPEYAAKSFEKMVAAVATPNFISQMTNLEMDGKIRMSDGLIESMNRRVWWRSKDMPIRPDAFGDEQYYPTGIAAALVNPFFVRPDMKDPIAERMVELDVSLPDLTPKEVSYNDIQIKLSTEQRSRMGVMIGKGAKKGNKEGIPAMPPMKKVISNLVNNPAFSRLPEKDQAERIQRLYRTRKKHVFKIMFRTDSGIQDQFRAGIQAKKDLYKQAKGGSQ